MLPFVMLPRPLQESNVVGKGGTAGFLGRAFDPYTLYPPGDDMDMNKMDRIRIDDLQLQPRGLRRPARAAGQAPRGDRRRDAGHRQGRGLVQARRVLPAGPEPDRLRPGPRGLRLGPGTGQGPRPLRPQHLRPKLPVGAAAGRGRHPRRRGHLAQGRQFRQSLLGPPRRPDRADEEPVRARCSTRGFRP